MYVLCVGMYVHVFMYYVRMYIC